MDKEHLTFKPLVQTLYYSQLTHSHTHKVFWWSNYSRMRCGCDAGRGVAALPNASQHDIIFDWEDDGIAFSVQEDHRLFNQLPHRGLLIFKLSAVAAGVAPESGYPPSALLLTRCLRCSIPMREALHLHSNTTDYVSLLHNNFYCYRWQTRQKSSWMRAKLIWSKWFYFSQVGFTLAPLSLLCCWWSRKER